MEKYVSPAVCWVVELYIHAVLAMMLWVKFGENACVIAHGQDPKQSAKVCIIHIIIHPNIIVRCMWMLCSYIALYTTSMLSLYIMAIII